MRFARGAKAAREAEDEKEIEAQLAMVAVQLNMIDEAKQLYKDCGRYDLLGKMLQASGNWDEALEVAEKYNRINLKNTHYQMARHFESARQFEKAVEHYVQSDTHRREVPRMLSRHQMFDKLERFVQLQEDPDIYKWWAQYQEVKQNIEGAFQYYKLAKDYASLVRIYC